MSNFCFNNNYEKSMKKTVARHLILFSFTFLSAKLGFFLEVHPTVSIYLITSYYRVLVCSSRSRKRQGDQPSQTDVFFPPVGIHALVHGQIKERKPWNEQTKHTHTNERGYSQIGIDRAGVNSTKSDGPKTCGRHTLP